MINSSFNLEDCHSITDQYFIPTLLMTVFTSNHLDFPFSLTGINPIKIDRVRCETLKVFFRTFFFPVNYCELVFALYLLAIISKPCWFFKK